MVKRAIIAIVALFTFACATPQPQIIYKQVPAPYPVMIYCQVVIPPKPDLPIGQLQSGSTADQTIAAYVDSVIILKSEVTKRDHLLQACKEGENGQSAATTGNSVQ